MLKHEIKNILCTKLKLNKKKLVFKLFQIMYLITSWRKQTTLFCLSHVIFCGSFSASSKFALCRVYRCSLGDNIFWRGWLMCSAPLGCSLRGGVASLMSLLAHANAHARQIAAHGLIHWLFGALIHLLFVSFLPWPLLHSFSLVFSTFVTFSYPSILPLVKKNLEKFINIYHWMIFIQELELA